MEEWTKNKLSFVAIIKNEAPYIIEWIEFHKLVGVGKFYIYDNESTDEIRNILKPYILDNTVVYHWFPGKERQLAAYEDAIKRYKNKTKYMGFIDLDEFVIPVNRENLVDTLEKILKQDNHAAGIGMNWRIYGSSYYEKMPDGLVLENYKLRARDEFIANKHIKTICNPRLVTSFPNPHHPIYQEGFYNIGEDGERIDGPYNRAGTAEKIRVNHYFTKSKIEYILKAFRGKADSPGKRAFHDFKKHDGNEIEDHIVDKYLPTVRQNRQEAIRKLPFYPDYPSLINQTNPNLLRENRSILDYYQIMRSYLAEYYDILLEELEKRRGKRKNRVKSE